MVDCASLRACGGPVLAGPWVVGNMRELGAPILLRAISAWSSRLQIILGAVHPADPRLAHWTRLTDSQTMHLTEAQLRGAGGEVAYYRALGQTAWEWIVLIPGISSLYAGAGSLNSSCRPVGFGCLTRPHGSAQWLASGHCLACGFGGIGDAVAMAPFRRA